MTGALIAVSLIGMGWSIYSIAARANEIYVLPFVGFLALLIVMVAR